MDSFSSAQPNLFAAGEPQWFPKATMPTAMAAMAAAPVMQAPAVAPVTQWYKTRWVWIAVLIAVVLLAIAYVNRTRIMGGFRQPTGPYNVAINAITSAERQADLREWAQLWSIAKRPAVKRVLAEVLNSELTPVGGSAPEHSPSAPALPASTLASTSASTPASNSTAAADPAFTVA